MVASNPMPHEYKTIVKLSRRLMHIRYCAQVVVRDSYGYNEHDFARITSTLLRQVPTYMLLCMLSSSIDV
jgi:hypothetical protein